MLTSSSIHVAIKENCACLLLNKIPLCVCTAHILFAHLLKGVELIILLFGYILGHILTVVKNVYLLGVNDFLSWIRSGVSGSYWKFFFECFQDSTVFLQWLANKLPINSAFMSPFSHLGLHFSL